MGRSSHVVKLMGWDTGVPMTPTLLTRLKPIPASVRSVWSLAPATTLALAGGSLAVAALTAGEVLLVRSVVDALDGANDATRALIFFGVVAAVRRTVASAMQQGQLYMAKRTEQAMTEVVLRTAALASFEEFEHPGFRDRVARGLQGARSRTWTLVWSLTSILTTTFTVALLTLVIVSIAPGLLAILAVAGVALLAASLLKSRAGHRLTVADTQDDRERAYLRAALISPVEGREMRLHGTGERLIERHEANMASFLERLGSTIRKRLAADLVANAILSATLVGALVIVAQRARSGELSIADAAAVALATQQLASQMTALSNATGSVAESALLLEDLVYFSERGGRSVPPPIPQSDVATIALEGCTYRYPDADANALSEVSLAIPRGSVVALVGANGSGKSTVAKLVSGLYRPTAGSVRTTTTSGESATADQPMVGVVSAAFQEFGRYELSVIENVSLGTTRRPQSDELDAALCAVGLADDIAKLPQGISTRLGRQFTAGQNLSGGQWQRLALARAIHARTPFVVLDEPTAAVDAAGERELFTSIRTLFPEAGILLISHRFATVRTADRILVLDEGRLVEDGSHSELMAAGSVYAGMFRSQAEHLLGDA